MLGCIQVHYNLTGLTNSVLSDIRQFVLYKKYVIMWTRFIFHFRLCAYKAIHSKKNSFNSFLLLLFYYSIGITMTSTGLLAISRNELKIWLSDEIRRKYVRIDVIVLGSVSNVDLFVNHCYLHWSDLKCIFWCNPFKLL